MNLNLVAKKTVKIKIKSHHPLPWDLSPYPTAKFGSHPFLAFSEHSIPPIKEGGGFTLCMLWLTIAVKSGNSIKRFMAV